MGKGSCSVIDECYTDSEIIEVLDKKNLHSEPEALKWAFFIQDLYLQQALNARWGDDDDPQLLAYQTWKTEMAAATQGNPNPKGRVTK